jgi:hypothetical protein
LAANPILLSLPLALSLSFFVTLACVAVIPALSRDALNTVALGEHLLCLLCLQLSAEMAETKGVRWSGAPHDASPKRVAADADAPAGIWMLAKSWSLRPK